MRQQRHVCRRPQRPKMCGINAKVCFVWRKKPCLVVAGCESIAISAYFSEKRVFLFLLFFAGACVRHLEHTRAGPTTKCTSLEVVPTDSSNPKKPCLVKSAPHSKVPWSARGLGEKKKKKKTKRRLRYGRERHQIINYPTGYFKYPRKYFSYC